MKDIFKEYEGVRINDLRHIPEISFYNHNYYVGVKREGYVPYDLIYAESSDEHDITKVYVVLGDTSCLIGEASVDDGNTIRLINE